MEYWTASQWVIIPLLFITCLVVAMSLIGLLFGALVPPKVWQLLDRSEAKKTPVAEKS